MGRCRQPLSCHNGLNEPNNRTAMAPAGATSSTLDRQLSAVIDGERADQVEYARRCEEHQSKEVASRRLDDHADDDRNENAAEISGEIHHAAENAGAPTIGQSSGNAPVEPRPPQKEQRAREERDRSNGTAD